LTKGQRKAYAAEVGQLLSKLTENSGIPIRNDQWLREIGKTTGVAQSTLYDWWKAFCTETERTITPKQALDLDRQALSRRRPGAYPRAVPQGGGEFSTTRETKAERIGLLYFFTGFQQNSPGYTYSLICEYPAYLQTN
jgi:hypothetical protein